MVIDSGLSQSAVDVVVLWLSIALAASMIGLLLSFGDAIPGNPSARRPPRGK